MISGNFDVSKSVSTMGIKEPQNVITALPPKSMVFIDSLNEKNTDIDALDPLFEGVARYIVHLQTVSISSLQRKFYLGYNRANRLINQLEAAGFISLETGKQYVVVINNDAVLEMFFDQINKRLNSTNQNNDNIISVNTFSEIKRTVNDLKNYIALLAAESSVINRFAKSEENSINSKLKIYLLKDIINSYKELGYSFDLVCLEGQCLALIQLSLGKAPIEYEGFYNILLSELPEAKSFRSKTIQNMMDVDSSNNRIDENKYNIINLVDYDSELKKKYKDLIYRLMSLIIKADGSISDKETSKLNKLIQE